ncbi:hypothetical protein MYX78_10415 [Acidobacteria bacterium AH-259-G07]|nr:hypothetical protein [Acidobacteria bacterium AH-259-G07]
MKSVVCSSVTIVLLLSVEVMFAPRAQEHAAEVTNNSAAAAAKLLARNCYSCHNNVDKKGGLNLQTYATLMKGGPHGAPLVPGDSDKSRMILMVEGFLEPRMPYGGFLFDEDIQTLRDWIDAGAPAWTGDLARMKMENLPDIQPRIPVKPEIASLAFHPSERLLAAGTYKEVRLIDLDNGKTRVRLSEHAESVRAVAFSADGSLLAAAGGMPTRYGEVKIWSTKDWTLLHTLEGHNDCIYSIAFSPSGKLLATSSYDHLVKLWDVETGEEVRTFTGHSDAVFSVAFDPEGKRLVSASADRTVKIWDISTGEQLFRAFSESAAELYTLAFHPSGQLVAAAGVDKMIRIWRLSEEGGQLVRSTFAHGSPIIRLVFTPDGHTLISSGEDQLVKFWEVETLQEKHVEHQSDWVLALAVSPSGKVLALGRYDGSLSFYEMESN